MAATPNDIKVFFALAGFTITDQHLLMAQAALGEQRYGTDADGNPRTPNATDLVDWLFRQARAFVNSHTERVARQSVVIPEEDLLGG